LKNIGSTRSRGALLFRQDVTGSTKLRLTDALTVKLYVNVKGCSQNRMRAPAEARVLIVKVRPSFSRRVSVERRCDQLCSSRLSVEQINKWSPV
jgi:hypothetical protein